MLTPDRRPEAVRRRARPPGRRPRAAGRRGARDRRRERRRQVDADQDRLRRGDRRRGPIVIDGRALTAGSTTSALQPGSRPSTRSRTCSVSSPSPRTSSSAARSAGTASSTGRRRASGWSSCSSARPVARPRRRPGGGPPGGRAAARQHRQGTLRDPVVLILDEPSAILTDREIGTAVRRRPGHAGRRCRGDLHQPPAGRAGPDHRPGHRAARRRGGRQPAHAEFSVRDVAELMVGHVLETAADGPCTDGGRAGARRRAPQLAPASSRTSRSPCAPARSWRSTV